jgi:hypothetical protein
MHEPISRERDPRAHTRMKEQPRAHDPNLQRWLPLEQVAQHPICLRDVAQGLA